jgi:glycosyltransferase involved in cell wall biosynthesis
MPQFSIVIPTYNRVKKLKSTIQSVLDQTFDDFELLIMDDGSIDDTGVMVNEFGDSRIKYEWSKNSGGPATPRNRGIELATAPWISFLDADDIWYSNRLSEVAEAIKLKPKFDVFCHNEVLSYLGTDKKAFLKYGPFETNFYSVMLRKGNRLSTSAVTIRTDFLFNNNLRFNQDKDFVIVEDFDLWLNLANFNASFYFIDKYLGEYVIEKDNISLLTSKNRNNLMTLLKKHVYEIQSFEPDKDKLWREVNLPLKISDATESFGKCEFISGLKLLSEAIIYNPFDSIKVLSEKILAKVKFKIDK